MWIEVFYLQVKILLILEVFLKKMVALTRRTLCEKQGKEKNIKRKKQSFDQCNKNKI